MKILFLDDIHIECHGDNGKAFLNHLPKDVDALIIAGDWVQFSKPYAEKVVRLFTEQYPHVISIFGNHEYWGSSPTEVANKVADIQDRLPNYCGQWHPLDKSTVTINNVTFAGATTWFPDTPESRLFQMQMNDFQYIKDFVPWVYEENERCIEFWETVEADIWISHHLPSYKAVDPKFATSPINCYFVEPALEGLIGYKQPKYFLGGHTHNSYNFNIGNTVCLSNPYGYESSDMRGLNNKFKYDYVIEI